MATSQSRTVKHSRRDIDIALRRKPGTEPETVSPPELTVPGTQLRRFDIYCVPWNDRPSMAKELTEYVNKLAKRTKAVVVVVGQSQDDSGINYTLEYWTY